MRLINARFADEVRFFWDERAVTLEDQTSQPIQDHVEMGFSGTNGDPTIDSLINRLSSIDYYARLFESVYGDPTVSEPRIQKALAQFIRSIQSFDSRFDEGLTQTNNLNQPFPNFSNDENAGKQLFLAPPPAGGAGCAGCHRPPEFDIDPNSGNNGITGVAGDPNGTDFTNTRAPSIRDLLNPNGTLNGPLMHTGRISTLEGLIEHYNQVPINPNNTNLDPRLAGPGSNLNLTNTEKNQLIAFLKTLTGEDVYTNEKWSNPFDDQGNFTLLPELVGLRAYTTNNRLKIYPNPSVGTVYLTGLDQSVNIEIYGLTGQLQKTIPSYSEDTPVNLDALATGTYLIRVNSTSGHILKTERLILH